MANRRFTDSKKWQDEWFGSLSNDNRIVWLWLVDNCSLAGIWKKDFRSLNFNCNVSISEEDFRKLLAGRVIEFEKYYFIPKFLKFQNPSGISSNKPVVTSIRKEILENNLENTVIESLGNDYLMIGESLLNDKLIIKGKGIGKGIGNKGGVGENGIFNDSLIITESLADLQKKLKEENK